ncbi:helix-turn-helix domain-containing protein [Pseudopedobacter beijingensis]|uniref:Helix-turn-helix domain-containing protein n=1 Tax=Pseudopedobacter beijingensis TaxID=1207056 RepID=A0ABW4IBH2_9SPHI
MRRKLWVNLMLGIVLAAIAWYSLMIYLMISGEVCNFPNLYNKGNPLYYLFAPCSYLYIKLSLSKNKKLHKYDWLHFIPAALSIIDLVPYMLKSPEERQYIVDLVAQDPKWNFQYKYAFLTHGTHNIIRAIQQIIYIVFQTQLLIKFRNEIIDKKQKYWLFTYNAFFSVLTISTITVLVRTLLFSAEALRVGFLPLFASVGILIFCILFFFKPEQIYGTAFIEDKETQTGLSSANGGILTIHHERKEDPLKLNPEQIADYTQKLEKKIISREYFKEKGITVSLLAAKINIPQRHLTTLLKQHYNLKFNDFINNYRIAFVKDKIEKGEWKNLTIEALAEEAGFSSRSTFYAAFKKSTGTTPVEYIEKGTVI